MAIRYSTEMNNQVLGKVSLRNALRGARLKIFSGTQPTTADDAASGTLLVTLTPLGATTTAETRATATLTITGASGSIDTMTVGGGIPLIDSAVSFDTDVSTTAANLVDAINAAPHNLGFEASSLAGVVTIEAPIGLGASANGLTVAVTTTTLAAAINGGSSAAFGGTGSTAGVDGTNDITWAEPSAGAISLDSILSGTAVSTANAGWFRIEADLTDDQTTSTSFRRIDGDIATSGADLNAISISITSGQSIVLSDLDIYLGA